MATAVPLPIREGVATALLEALRRLLANQLIRVGAKRLLAMLGAAITPEIVSKIILIGLSIWLIWDLIEIFNYYFNIREILGSIATKILDEIYAEDSQVPLPDDWPPNLEKCIRRCIDEAVARLNLFSWAKGNGDITSIAAALRNCIRVCFGLM
jgi:hypothetical protein